ncbi:dipeptide/oligopeptide/nickel ABC transporter permease/ATP-binding protein [Haematobacter genomosp. 1]|uniref:Dipeptide/oligopeptide/nickel ABC transporter ATP-binding protein n=1 Tax=Haematobacter genomosp. 1 TaxID=366618 RepID=A0A212ADR6_9RHOB|nr:dipeptide/oligopeptide/nickel ABC transporter permease/ATP-binding protein [Haematobacter genomosp. 1]OWJ79344.1 dipeptide/oligopeptide/nickel ABC transporter ATP-binding protein [Haematobacter genomosp. 1]
MTSVASVFEPEVRHRRQPVILSVLLRPLGFIAIGWLVLIVLASIFADQLSAYDPVRQNLLAIKQLPSMQHPLGTDAFGRDILSRLLHGGAATLTGVVQALAVAGVLGVGMGVLAGYFGRKTDRVIGMILEIIMTLPNIIILLVIITIFNRNMTVAMATVGVIGSANIARVVRAAVLSIRGELYIEAARITGLGDAQIILRHVLPRIIGPIIVQLSIFAALAVLIQTGISFLGLGAPPPQPSWGGMIYEASLAINDFQWLLVPSGAAVALTILAFGLLGDTLRDVLADRWSAPVAKGRAVGATVAPGRDSEPFDRNAVLSLRGLTIVTRKNGVETALVDDLGYDIQPGQTLGLVGESGSGKTLGSLALIGLLPAGTRVVSGRMLFDGREYDLRDTASLTPLRGRQIGMIFQEPMAALDPCFTIGSQLAEVARMHGAGSGAEARRRALEALEQVQIPDAEAVMRKYPHQVSGGMAQRVGIARTLLPQPKILLADEPTTALDVTVQAEILDLIRHATEQRGMATLLVTHDWGVVADICDRALVMFRGRKLEDADIEDLFARPSHRYTRALLAANPHGAAVGSRLPTIRDTFNAMEGAAP